MKKNKYRFLIPLLGLIVVVAVILPAFLNYFMFLNNPDKKHNNQNPVKEYKTKRLKYNISKSFENVGNSDLYKSYYFEDYNLDIDIDCRINIDVDKNRHKYKDGKDYLMNSYYYYLADEISGIEKTTINNQTWFTIEKKEKYKTSDFYPDKPNYNNDNIYTYATIYKDYIYEINYTINDRTSGEYDGTHPCYTEMDSFVSSLKFK